MIEDNGYTGIFEIICTNKKTGEIKAEVVKNRLTNEALDKFINILGGVAPDMEIKYLAVGTDGAALSDTSTQLVAEVFRTEPSIDPQNVSTGRVETSFDILDSEANVHIMELGIFCGSIATASANTGILLTRILYDKVKTSSEELSIKRIDIVRRS